MANEHPDLQAQITTSLAALTEAIDLARRDHPDDLGDLLRTAYMLSDLSHLAEPNVSAASSPDVAPA